MGRPQLSQSDGFKKLQIADTVTFALKNIPSVDERTLQAFLELVNVTGTFGVISHEQIVNRIRQVIKYVPDACPRSLLILADLLELKTVPAAPTLAKSRPPTLSRAGSPQLGAAALPQKEPVPMTSNGRNNYM